MPDRTASPAREQQQQQQQHKKTDDDGTAERETNKEIWTEEDAEAAQQQQEQTAADEQPKLVTTNILADQARPQNGPRAEPCEESSLADSGGSGDAASGNTKAPSDPGEQAAPTSDNKLEESSSRVEISEKTVGPSEGKSEDGSSSENSESSQNGEEDAEEVNGAEVGPCGHSRPVLIHKSLPPAEAALREKGNGFFRCGQYPEAIEVYTEIIGRLEAGQSVFSLVHSYRLFKV